VDPWAVYAGKKVLVTGHTGFKGSWLGAWLVRLGAEVIGVALDPPSRPSNYEALGLNERIKDLRQDVRDSKKLGELIARECPDFIFHLAAQALVRASYADPIGTLSTNALGTASVLEAIRQSAHPVVAVLITSDKAYDNAEWVWGYRETDRLGGKDPYSASKGMAELAIRAYVESYFQGIEGIRIGVARAGNVIGGGDWAADRIVPDCVRAWAGGDRAEIRNPRATRPWQHVLEPLSGYLVLGAALADDGKCHGEAYNFGPAADQDHSVAELIREFAKHWQNARWTDVSSGRELPEAGLLKLNCDKAMAQLGWQATLQFEQTVRMTAEWYLHYYRRGREGSMLDYTLEQIESYMDLFARRQRSRVDHA